MDPRTTPFRPDLAAEYLRGKVDAPRYAQAVEMVVNVPFVDLYDKPGGHLVSQMLFGDRFDVFEKASWFAWGQNKRDGYVGYVVAARLRMAEGVANYRVKTNWAHIYPRPNMKVPTDRQPLPFMASVHAKDIVGDFVHVEGGFCPIQSLVETGANVADFVSVAEGFVGVPYLWGGCTPLGFDCSGLVQICLAAAGIQAPRDADQQENALGEVLSPDALLQRGDLIFWDGHVGIMQDAQRIVHANAHHMAVASDSLAAVIARAAEKGSEMRSRKRIAA
jgi:hypothetical protein